MSDQVTNKSAVPEESPVRVLEIAPPSSTPPPDKMLSRITILLFNLSGWLADGVRLLRELDLYHCDPSGISRNPV
jgi:hypothetical protein